jgi:hypothetical protein
MAILATRASIPFMGYNTPDRVLKSSGTAKKPYSLGTEKAEEALVLSDDPREGVVKITG